MIDYNLEKALEIIRNCNESQISETIHFNIRNTHRNNDVGIVHNVFLNSPTVGIIKQDLNKFKVYFEHPTKTSKDIVIIFEIDDNECIKFITTFLTKKDQREK